MAQDVILHPDTEQQDPHQALREKHPRITDRQHQLIMALVSGARSITAAAEQIGAQRSWASSTLMKPHVQAYAQAVGLAEMGGNALRAVYTLGRLLNARGDRVKLDAAVALLDRAGIIKRTPVQQQQQLVKVEINLD